MLQIRQWWTSRTTGLKLGSVVRTIISLAVIAIGIWFLAKGVPRAISYFRNSTSDSTTTSQEEQFEFVKIDSTPVVVLKPVPIGCSVSDSTQTFCSSNTQVIRILEAGDLLLLNPGTTRVCAKKPLKSITYKVALNDRLRFTSALDLENTRCDIFIVTRVPR